MKWLPCSRIQNMGPCLLGFMKVQMGMNIVFHFIVIPQMVNVENGLREIIYDDLCPGIALYAAKKWNGFIVLVGRKTHDQATTEIYLHVGDFL